MISSNKKEYFVYFIGDIFFFIFSLWVALSIRHFSFPEKDFFLEHIPSFSLLCLFWIFVFYAFGLYDKQTSVSKKKLPSLIFNAQGINCVIGVFFFYFFPFFGVTPKVNLLIYILVSSIFIVSWRLLAVNFLKVGPKQKAIVLVSNKETKEIANEIKNNLKYNIDVVSIFNLEDKEEINLKEDIKNIVGKDVSIIVADFQDDKIKSLVPFFYELFFSKIIFFDAQKIYEEIFDRISLAGINHQWFLENIYFHKTFHDFVKRIMDLLIAIPLSLFSLLLYPLVFLSIKLDDRGPVFITQERVGIEAKPIKIVKFRSMKTSDKGAWVEEKDERITRVGCFLRKTRIDELPQLFNVIKGDISLVGPRPDIKGLKDTLEKEIPYYNVRNLVRPGLSGWAQIKQEKPPQSIEETKERLMYDFYYIKNRSLFLDFKIALRTIQILFSRSGI
jgi:exopolysaccharide biosynthesis polyprenyl glycosylphosphotransferase